MQPAAPTQCVCRLSSGLLAAAFHTVALTTAPLSTARALAAVVAALLSGVQRVQRAASDRRLVASPHNWR